MLAVTLHYVFSDCSVEVNKVCYYRYHSCSAAENKRLNKVDKRSVLRQLSIHKLQNVTPDKTRIVNMVTCDCMHTPSQETSSYGIYVHNEAKTRSFS